MGAAVAAVGGALWYAVIAPRQGGDVNPGGGVQVVLSATASGSGGWVRYLLTVKNVADGDFAGEVRLIDADDTGQNRSPANALPTNLNQARVPLAAEVAGQSAYQVSVSVPSRTSRTVTIIAPDSFNLAEIRAGDQILTQVPVDPSQYLPIAVVSDVDTAATAISALHFDRMTPGVTLLESARQLPATPTLWAGYSMVVIDQFDTQTLSAAQVGALREFVGLGGSLVLAGGSGWRRTLSPLPQDLVPLRPSSTAEVSLAPVAELAGQPEPDVVVPAAVGSLTQGAQPILTGSDGTPLAAELSLGSGHIFELTWDPAGDQTKATAYSTLGWGQSVARGIGQLTQNGPGSNWLLAPEAAFTALVPQLGNAQPPSPVVFGAVLFLYLLMVGPLNYLVVKRILARPALFWFTAPALSAAFAGVFYLAGAGLQSPVEDRQLQVVRAAPGGAVSLLNYDRVLFLRRGSHEIGARAGSLVAPLTLDTYRVTGSTCDRCTGELQGLPSGAEKVLPGPQPLVEESGVVYGSVRVVGSTATARGAAGVEAHLSVIGGRVQGTVRNLGGAPVLGLTLFTFDGQGYNVASLAPTLPPQGGIGVDGALSRLTPNGGPPTLVPGSLSSLLEAVAASELVTQGQPVLVGLTAPIGDALTVDGGRPPGAAVAVVQQPVQLQHADSLLRNFDSRRLMSTVGDSTKGFLDVYDLSVPTGAAALALRVDLQSEPGIQIYDWSTGTFSPAVPTPGTVGNASISLGASQIRDGVVRVRAREPRLLWGADMWLDTPA